METNFKEFPKICKEEWLSKIEKEYRGKKTFADLELKLSDDLIVSPYVHKDDNILPIEITNFPEEQKPGIILEEWMSEKDLMSLLETGISSLFVPQDLDLNISKFPSIQWDLLNVFVESEKVYAEVKTLLSNTADKLFLLNDSNKPVSLPDMYQKNLSTTTFAEVIRKQVDGGFVRVQIGDQLLFQIGVLRGILDYAQKENKEIQILAFCSPTESYEEEGLITTTTQSLAARLGGVAHIFNPRMSEDSKFAIYKAMIHNLLDMESKMQELSDPLSGSYYVENITRQVSKLLS